MERDANHRTIPLQLLCVVNNRDSAAPLFTACHSYHAQGTGCQTRKSDSTSFALTLTSAVAARRSFDGGCCCLNTRRSSGKIGATF